MLHKCQGLSLDCAIIDLSENVFSDGMAYVALSRVRSLLGLHLVAFHPKSIMVSISSIQETSRLRKQNTKLPLHCHIMVMIITPEMNRCGLLNSIQLMSSGSIMHVQLLVFSL